MKFAVVDENAASAKLNVRNRLERVRENPIRNRKAGLRRSGSGIKKTRVGGGGPAKEVAKLSTEELDKELEAYMSIRNTTKD